METKWRENPVMPFQECPQYYTCSANPCPLDFDVERRVAAEPDDEQCTARRSTREDIAASYPKLSWHGLTAEERLHDERAAVNRARWEALSPEEQTARRAMLEANRHRPFKGQPRPGA